MIHNGPHLSDDSAHRHAALLAMLVELRMENDRLRHDLNAANSHIQVVEELLAKRGLRVTTPRESPVPALVKIEEEE